MRTPLDTCLQLVTDHCSLEVVFVYACIHECSFHISSYSTEMCTPQQKAKCVLWFNESKSATQVQRTFRNVYHQDPPTRQSIYRWMKQFKDTGSVAKKKSPGRPPTSVENVQRVKQAFERSPRQSVRRAARELQLPRSTVHDVLRKRLHMFPYKIQMVQQLQPDDGRKRMEFAMDVLERLDDNPDFLSQVIFSDEATFHTSGKVNRYNCRIWGTQHPHVLREHERDSPKVNVWCGLFQDRVVGPFFFAEATVTGIVYLDMLENFVMPQLEDIGHQVFFQQDGAPPHWNLRVREFLDERMPGRWIGRGGPLLWPPRSPDITPLDFFFWGYVKERVYATKVDNLDDLKQRIRASIATITPEMLQATWREIEYRLDTLRATGGAHIDLY